MNDERKWKMNRGALNAKGIDPTAGRTELPEIVLPPDVLVIAAPIVVKGEVVFRGARAPSKRRDPDDDYIERRTEWLTTSPMEAWGPINAFLILRSP